MGASPFVSLAPLIGRELERAFARSALARPDVHFLTLTGPDGIGKTCLALELTAELASAYDDGAHVVDLEGLTDPELVLPAIAGTIGLPGDGSTGTPALETCFGQDAPDAGPPRAGRRGDT